MPKNNTRSAADVASMLEEIENLADALCVYVDPVLVEDLVRIRALAKIARARMSETKSEREGGGS